MKLTDNAKVTLERRYLRKNPKGETIESPEDMLHRVAVSIAKIDGNIYDKSQKEVKELENKFYKQLDEKKFMPNSPTLMNAGRELQQLSACFVLPIKDSMESIFETLKHMALVQKTGGGTGFSFDHLRPAGDFVKSTNGVASGPISFLKIYDAGTEAVKQGGTRRGANMGTLRYDHPDILDFIKCKTSETDITNFNISIPVSDEFMKKATGIDPDPMYCLINPRTGKPHVDIKTNEVKQLNAIEIMDLIAEMAWKNGDPGLIFIDKMNKFNPTPHIGKYESTNPCGEQPLLPYEACCLGSINLSLFVDDKGEIMWDNLKETVHIAVHFEDNVIDATSYVIPQIEETHKKKNRKIGIGVMGWHDMLIKLRIPYDSEEALSLARKVMKFINDEAKQKSIELAKERGTFPSFKGSIYETGKNKEYVRNATRTTIAPTGTISIIAGASSGIEPYFSIAFVRKNVLGGVDLAEVNPLFLDISQKEGFYSEELIKKISENGSVQDITEIPDKVKSLFKTSLEIDYSWHVKHQAAFQQYTDNAVSKTINMKKDATIEDVKNAYILAWELGCKGITVYRDGSKSIQVLNVGVKKEKENYAQLKPLKRPQKLTGVTIRKETPLGNLFVTLNKMDDVPFEVFAQIGKAGSDILAFTEGIARLISLALRCEISADEIIEQLEGIGGGRSVGFGPNRVLSVPDAIGKALRELLEVRNNNNGTMEICPECGQAALIFVEGCAKCQYCGHSEC